MLKKFPFQFVSALLINGFMFLFISQGEYSPDNSKQHERVQVLIIFKCSLYPPNCGFHDYTSLLTYKKKKRMDKNMQPEKHV